MFEFLKGGHSTEDTKMAEKQLDQIIEDINVSAAGIEQDGLSELSDVDLADLSSAEDLTESVGNIIDTKKAA